MIENFIYKYIFKTVCAKTIEQYNQDEKMLEQFKKFPLEAPIKKLEELINEMTTVENLETLVDIVKFYSEFFGGLE